ncbi:coatomer delta subunit, putative [Theileria annulata]|uniref:Coatomer subunit delta n=1 Tax=Theileria annulata TaxID=5874 RepID=Q4U9X7_THEAN|nr:coatomer delta subunit, putative [Theileria annulata]CAI76376.1 coatomer delta subunit, putative [Theileria annulata]|eukprot:XP_953001.1 coatomer delta subunit, putative [Theileria annulata]
MSILSTGLASEMRILVSRQHTPMTREEIESCFSNFLRLIENKSGDHTFVESDKNRFLYQLVDNFYVFVMTTLDSNIIEDLIVLKTLCEIVQNLVKPVINEENILKNIFDILFYMDELVSNNQGENMTFDQIKVYIEMDSYEEKLHKKVEKSKVKEEEKRREMTSKMEKRKQLDKLFIDPSYPTSHSSYQEPPPVIQEPKIQLQSRNISQYNTIKKLKEKEIAKIVEGEAPVVVQIIETCNGNLHLDGDVDSLNVQGELVTTVFEEQAQSASLQFTSNKDIKMKYHPMVDKKMVTKSKIELQNGFNLAQPLSIIKWKYKLSEEDFPLSVTCWPSEGTTECVVVIEITNNSNLTFNDLTFQVLHSRFDNIKVNYNEGGNVDSNPDSLVWVVPTFSESDSVKLEFSTTTDLNNILPFTLVANSQDPLSNVKVLECYDKNSGEALTFLTNQQVYNRDDVTIRLPYYKNPKNRFIKIVEQTSNVEYTPIEKLLEKVKVNLY